ncbi:hypothetical protein SBDP1_290022 [Syntrophobacter sp. SbD1]|nr:hypothetical protein SBDP1_290022 [Syntrophobacter sp. SbD1]
MPIIVKFADSKYKDAGLRILENLVHYLKGN